jgi:hypothetical protein
VGHSLIEPSGACAGLSARGTPAEPICETLPKGISGGSGSVKGWRYGSLKWVPCLVDLVPLVGGATVFRRFGGALPHRVERSTVTLPIGGTRRTKHGIHTRGKLCRRSVGLAEAVELLRGFDAFGRRGFRFGGVLFGRVPVWPFRAELRRSRNPQRPNSSSHPLEFGRFNWSRSFRGRCLVQLGLPLVAGSSWCSVGGGLGHL